ncbi:RalA-binding protein 1 [Heterocephalus glaber]|uniref:RalA-binding protein 1 n=1 Tax=Heterocephalus glaber TaxID=10181 RepID=G5BZ92_HETGA|nr:RalA-binding protein 1 [Heterocephalus glaber]
MTECFLTPTSSPGEHSRAERGSELTRTPSSEEISLTKFPSLYRTGEPSPPHNVLHEPPDIMSDDEKDHGKKKGKFKKKEKRTEGYDAFQEDSSGDEAKSPSKMKRSKGIYVFKKPSFSKKKGKDFKIKEKPKEEKHKKEKHKEEKHKEKMSKDLTAANVVKIVEGKEEKEEADSGARGAFARHAQPQARLWDSLGQRGGKDHDVRQRPAAGRLLGVRGLRGEALQEVRRHPQGFRN